MLQNYQLLINISYDVLVPNSGRSHLMTKVTLEVNGKKVSKEVPDHTLLSVFLRDNLNLTGTHVGCDTSQCGACVVHVNGK